MKIIELLKVSELKISPMEFKYFSNTLFIYLNGRSHVIFSPGFRGEKNLNSRRSRMKNENLGKSFYSLSFNFQKVFEFTHFHSINQSNLSVYYNIPKFRILGCYMTNLLQKDIPFVFDDDCVEAFEILKESIVFCTYCSTT